jgi:acyl carrier protein
MQEQAIKRTENWFDNHDEIKAEVVRILVEFTGNKAYLEAGASIPLSELGLDSLGIFQLLLEIEKQLQCVIPEEHFTLSGLVTLGDLVALVGKGFLNRNAAGVQIK